MLSLNHNRPLAQRIMIRYKVELLSKDEVAAYINHHMKLAGAGHTIFSDNAMQAISSLSRGWPRLVNKIATLSLFAGCQAKKDSIDKEVVRLSAEDAGI